MWFSSLPIAALAAAAGISALASCGFEPMHAGDSAEASLRGKIKVQLSEGDVGFAMTERLRDLVGHAPANPEYLLSVSVQTETKTVSIASDNAILRLNLVGRATADLSRVDNGETVYRDQLTNFTSYSATGSTVGTLTARKDAEKRLVWALAEQTVARILAVSPG